jgi:hypothetical protein
MQKTNRRRRSSRVSKRRTMKKMSGKGKGFLERASETLSTKWMRYNGDRSIRNLSRPSVVALLSRTMRNRPVEIERDDPSIAALGRARKDVEPHKHGYYGKPEERKNKTQSKR